MTDKTTYRQVLANGEYRKLWLGQGLSQLGDNVSLIAIPLIIYQMTQSAWGLAVSFLMSTLPLVLIGPFGGILADRMQKKWVICLTDGVRALLILAIFFAEQSWQIYLLVFCAQLLNAIYLPAFSALIPTLVGKELLVKTISLSHVTFNTMKITGPAIAGAMLTMGISARQLLWVDLITFLASLIFVVLINEPLIEKAKSNFKAEWQNYRDALASFYVKSNPVAKLVVSFSSVSIFKAFFTVALLIQVQQLFDESLEDVVYSQIYFAIAGGTLLGSLLYGKIHTQLEKTTWVALGLISHGLLLSGFMLLDEPMLLVIWGGIAGLTISFTDVTVSAWLAGTIEPAIRGRVYSSINALLSLGSVTGFLACGWLGNWFSPSQLMTIAGAGMIVIAVVYLLAFDKSESLENAEQNA